MTSFGFVRHRPWVSWAPLAMAFGMILLSGMPLRRLDGMSTPNNPHPGPFPPHNPYGQGTVQSGQTPAWNSHGQGSQGWDGYGQRPSSAQPSHSQNPYAQNPYAQNPYVGGGPSAQSSYAQNPYVNGQAQAQPPRLNPADPYQEQVRHQQGRPAYGMPYGPAYPVEAPMNTLSIVSLICAFFFSPAGLVCGIVSLGQIKRTGERGKGMAIAGVVISVVKMVIEVLIVVLTMAVVTTTTSDFYHSYSDGGYSYDYGYGTDGQTDDYGDGGGYGDMDPSDPYGGDDGEADGDGMQAIGWIAADPSWVH